MAFWRAEPVRIAVTGREGQVVQALQTVAPEFGVTIIAVGRPELDLEQPASIAAALTAARPDVIVSAAAYTAVDRAETEQELARRINADGAGAVAETAAALDVPLVHLSTDYVFDGDNGAPYVEDDITGPSSVYGVTKLGGEELIRAKAANHAILRTSWVYSPFGRNFLKTMLRLGENQPAVRVVGDQKGSPTSALDIARAVIQVAQRLKTDPAPRLRGTFHLCGTGEATWASFAQAIFAAAEAETGRAVHVEPIATADYPTPARRPSDSRMVSDKLRNTYGIALPDWRISTAETVRQLLSQDKKG